MKTAALVVAMLALCCLPMHAQTLPNYTMADVAKHATTTDCWMVINTTKVYNLTTYISKHPGGTGFTRSCGKDGTASFNSVGHSSSANTQLATYQIGNLTTISVSVSPSSVSLQTGKSQLFTATVQNSTQGVTWSSTSLGTISTSGLFTAANTAGTATITATSVEDPTKSGTGRATITAPVVISVSISPSSATVQTGKTQQFTATVTNSTQGVTWTASGGTVSNTGLFTAGSTAGSGSVTAKSVQDNTKVASAPVSITSAPPPPITVAIAPATATLDVGGTQQFTATVTGSTQGVAWSSTGGIGNVSGSGLFTAMSGGSGSVVATSLQDSAKSSSATVTVNQPPPNPISVSVYPSSAEVPVGGQQKFSATVTNSTQGVKWSGGSTVGIIQQDGTFTASVEGTDTVVATSVQDATRSDTASVTVTPSGGGLPPVNVPLTAAEVAKHNKATDCWMIMNDKVYDVTGFVPEHPRKGAAMIPSCGYDATADFISAGHSNRAYSLLPKYYLGPLVKGASCSYVQSGSNPKSYVLTCNPSDLMPAIGRYSCRNAVDSVTGNFTSTCTYYSGTTRSTVQDKR